MKNEKPGFLLYLNQKTIIDELTNEEAGILLKAIYEYQETQKMPKLNKMLKIIFLQFKNIFDSDEKRYEEKCLKNKENIEKYWQKKKEQSNTNEYERIQMYTNINNNNNKNINKNININKNKNRNKIEEVVVNTTTIDTTPSFDFPIVLEYGEDKGADELYCRKFYEYYKNRDLDNWQLKFDEWVEKDGITKNNYKLEKINEGAFKL